MVELDVYTMSSSFNVKDRILELRDSLSSLDRTYLVNNIFTFFLYQIEPVVSKYVRL